MQDYNIIKEDFNEISKLEEPKWNHNNCYFKYIQSLIPDGTEICLDIGCGKGELSFLLSQKSKSVIAVDLADQMIEKAKARYAGENITFICGNILEMKFENNSLDAIVTTATAHHLPYEWLLCFAKEKLKEKGKLIILDLVRAESFSDYVLWGLAFFPNVILNLLKNHRLVKDDSHTKEVWEKHSEHDSYMTMSEITSHAKKHIPTARIERKLFWRYLLVWQK